ncbi:helix-turn-helix domain-containing protein, partial [Streptomyces boncukensis]
MVTTSGSGAEAGGTEAILRVTVDELRRRTGEQQSELAAALGLSPTGLSRRQSGKAAWKLEDVDRLAAHWSIPVPDLLTGTEHAAACLPADRVEPSRSAEQPAPPPEPPG